MEEWVAYIFYSHVHVVKHKLQIRYGNVHNAKPYSGSSLPISLATTNPTHIPLPSTFRNPPSHLALTFTHRTLHIKIHVGGTPTRPLPSAAHSWFHGQQLKTVCVAFTAISGLSPNPPPFGTKTPPPSQPASRRGWWTLYPWMSAPPPRGPVALYVCHESCALAISEGYELAFSGINFQPATDTEFADLWTTGGYGEKKIWVNWKIDTIFVGECNIHPHLGDAWFGPVALLTKYAKEEAVKIRCLAIDKCYELQRDKRTGMRMGMAPGPGRGLLGELKRFGMLERLVVYYISEEERRERAGGACTEKPDDGIEKMEKENLEGDILCTLQEEEKCPEEWKGKLPEVEVRRGSYWGYNSGK
jgi:hypothetical protein